MIEFSFRWRNKAFQVFDLENPIQEVYIKAENLNEAWKIWLEKHSDKIKMKDINVMQITQFR
jgi:hypothetical protein